MLPATRPNQRPPDARLLVVDECGRQLHARRAELPRFLRRDDLLVANDAAALPASLHGRHERTGLPIEVRLAARRSLAPDDMRDFDAVVFGAGDHRMRTEDRPLPPTLRPGDALALGPLRAEVRRVLGHPRRVALRFAGAPDTIRAGLARHGKPIQYAHVAQPLDLWDVWTRIAAVPVAFEPPSAGFLLDWATIATLASRGVGFATLTHAAGISSTGDPHLDAHLPFDEPYAIPQATSTAVARTRARGGRVVALGTTVVRALEHAARLDGVAAVGPGLATQRIGPATRLRVVDAIVSGTHEPGSSHYELLRAFAGADVLDAISATLDEHGYTTHEFGDSLLLARQHPAPACAASRPEWAVTAQDERFSTAPATGTGLRIRGGP
jgi:S-adenosylmethionine:tRNA ribosyltransferase-isomerase